MSSSDRFPLKPKREMEKNIHQQIEDNKGHFTGASLTQMPSELPWEKKASLFLVKKEATHWTTELSRWDMCVAKAIEPKTGFVDAERCAMDGGRGESAQ